MKQKYDPELIKDDLRKLIQQTLKEALEAELEEFLGYSKYERTNSNNSRNGYISKTVKTAAGEVEIETPRDRKGDFEPKIVKKRQTVLEDLENKIIALYSKGMTVRDIQELLSDMYGMDISPSLISKITDRLTPRIEEWQSRPLERIYVVLYIDCIFYKVRQDGKVIDKAVYVVIGVNKEGRKELLGFWINESESASFWFKVLNDLKSRGVKDVLIFSVDNLSGIGKAIKGVYPQAEIQKCVVHQIRNSLRYVSWKDKKELSSDLKKVYGAATLEEAELRMDEFEEKWGNKYPHVIKSWRTNWEELMAYFKYPLELRKLMYTTNIIESVNSKFRKVTDGKRVFPSDMSVLKSLYLAALELEKKWNRSVIKDWGIIYGQLSIIFEERLEA
ncbi:IS256 family transposase [Desulfurobacterium crinifex]